MMGERPALDALRWGGAGAVVLAAHVVAGLAILHASERGEGMAAPEPVFIDLAPAPPPGAEAASAQPITAAAQAETADTPAPDFTPPEMTQLPPVEDFADLISDPSPAPDFTPPELTELPPIQDFAALIPSELALATSDRPVARPVRRQSQAQPQQQRREPPARQAQPQRQSQPPRQQAAAPANRAQQAQPQRRQQASGGGGNDARAQSSGANPQQMANWRAQVARRIALHMSNTQVPRTGRRGQAQAVVSVTIQPSGAASARLAQGTGLAPVDNALIGQAGTMPRMPAPPNRQALPVTVPFAINLR